MCHWSRTLKIQQLTLLFSVEKVIKLKKHFMISTDEAPYEAPLLSMSLHKCYYQAYMRTYLHICMYVSVCVSWQSHMCAAVFGVNINTTCCITYILMHLTFAQSEFYTPIHIHTHWTIHTSPDLKAYPVIYESKLTFQSITTNVKL